VLTLIHRFLKAGVLTLEGRVEPMAEGTRHGGPLSPLLANLGLDELDKELEKRGHRFARDADEANIYVRSRQAGERVMASVRRFLERKLRLKVNEAKSAVDRPWNRTFLGFTVTRCQSNRRKVSEKALKVCRAKVRELTGRTRGRTIRQIVQELRQLILGGGRSSASPRSVPPCATWTSGSGGGCGATPGNNGAGGVIGSGENAAWAGSWPGPRPSQPTARGV